MSADPRSLWNQERELVQAAALRIEALEKVAEQRFDAVFAAAEAAGDPFEATRGPAFGDWMAARADTDAAWGRWSAVMHARPPEVRA